jgi:hypothetical protein
MWQGGARDGQVELGQRAELGNGQLEDRGWDDLGDRG